MIRPQEIRTGPGGAYATRQQGYDKHWGLAVCYITVNRNMYWWTRITVNTGINLRENTDPCSPFKQYQIIRENALTMDLESMIPGNTNAVASDYMYDFRPGAIIDNLYADILGDLLKTGSAGVQIDSGGGSTNNVSAYGAFVIERSNIEFTRDDFTSLRITLRSLGYGTTTIAPGANNPDGDGAGTDYNREAGIV